jgi:hypothetical protein
VQNAFNERGERYPSVPTRGSSRRRAYRMRRKTTTTSGVRGGEQGLTLVHFSAQLKRIMWDGGAFRDCFGGVQEVSGGIKE